MNVEGGVVTDAIRRLEHLYRGLLTRHGIDPVPKLQIEPPLDEEEARFFVAGITHDLFSINEDGYVQSTFLPDKSRGTTYQRMLPIYWLTRKAPLGRWVLYREGVCQLALASSMVLKYGWEKSQVQMEPSIPEFGALAYAVDLVVQSEDSKTLICGEVKKNLSEYQKFLKGFAHCCERGPHTKEQCAFKVNHAKYAFCWQHRPSYFLTACPGRQEYFALMYTADSISLTPIDNLPSKDHIELGRTG